MKPKFHFPTYRNSIVLPIVTIALTVVIFAADTFTETDIAVAVLYVAVVLLSVRFCQSRGVIFVSLGCIILTVLSYFLTTTSFKEVGLINTAISLLAIGLTTYLALKIESAKHVANILTETNRLRDALIGSVSHELRTPLASIFGGVSILADAPSVINDHRLASLANGIRDESMRLNNDIQNLLDAALITGQGLRSRRDWTDPADIVNAAAERIRVRYPTHGINLNLPTNLPMINVDPVLLEQALGQIIANAAKYSPSHANIRISANVKDSQLIVSVRDEGLGLSTEEKGHFAERFFRGQRHVGKIAGSGLGLWIANTFITSNGGTLDAQSSGEGQGTTIRIAFPIPPTLDNNGLFAEED
jgi:two-component system sensor histidine kinase KdpD